MAQTVGHAVQPAADRVPFANAAGLAGEDEEGGLKSVLGVCVIAEQTPTNVHDHRLVAPDQFRERRRVAIDREPREEVAVGAAGGA